MRLFNVFTDSKMRLLQLSIVVGCAIAQDVDFSQYVNPFIGSEGAIPGYACKLTSTASLTFSDST